MFFYAIYLKRNIIIYAKLKKKYKIARILLTILEKVYMLVVKRYCLEKNKIIQIKLKYELKNYHSALQKT